MGHRINPRNILGTADYAGGRTYRAEQRAAQRQAKAEQAAYDALPEQIFYVSYFDEDDNLWGNWFTAKTAKDAIERASEQLGLNIDILSAEIDNPE
ncbi:hypothetical protein [Hymenobacter sp. UYP22]|uniref:hypothetical protein n=1 Tax=Hymenobacter sp. UYP22 TaxID=3156348 RepID=UPI0033938D21